MAGEVDPLLDPTIGNPLISSIFNADPTQGLTYEQLKQRRAIAATLAARSRGYPTTVGKGIFSVGEDIGRVIEQKQLDAAERAFRARSAAEEKKNIPKVDPNIVPAPPPDTGPPGNPVTPAPVSDAGSTTSPLASNIDLSRAQMTEALMRGADESSPGSGDAVRMAAYGDGDTLSDAGQPGATYGGASPAGPGASLAERPDQSLPAPSAPPPMTAGASPIGTPGPDLATAGGGVPPVAGPAGMAGPSPAPAGLPPGVNANRSAMAAQIAGLNQSFNPDAAGPAGPGAGAPPTKLAQVGGFGYDSLTKPLPPTLPPSGPASRPPGPGQRPVIAPEFTPPTQKDIVQQFGPVRKPPAAWDPDLLQKYNYANTQAQRADMDDQYTSRMRKAAEDIKSANQTRYEAERNDFSAWQTNRKTQENTLVEKMREANSPEGRQKRSIAEANFRITEKTGLPAEEVHKSMNEEKKLTNTAIRRNEDNQVVMQAIKDGVITGTGADYRLNAAKFAGWAFGSEYMKQKAINTEVMLSRLKQGIPDAVRDLRPISSFETKLGGEISGADPKLEQQSVESIVRQSIARNNEQIASYDTKANHIYGGEPQGKLMKSDDIPYTFVPKHHLDRLFSEPPSARTIENFNNEYGPGTAQMLLNRRRLLDAQNAREAAGGR